MGGKFCLSMDRSNNLLLVILFSNFFLVSLSLSKIFLCYFLPGGFKDPLLRLLSSKPQHFTSSFSFSKV